MQLYKYLADHYEYIFPAEKKIEFLDNIFKAKEKILDIGTSDGRVAKGLSHRGYYIEAIDLSEDMVRIARQVSKGDFPVHAMDMMEVDEYFEEDSFDGIFCIGNTLVHLSDYKSIEETLKKFKKILRENESLVIQILNYDYIYNKNIEELPLIDNEKLSFKRHYVLEEESVIFQTKLKIKSTNKEYQSETILFPIRKNSLERALKEAGFREFKYYGGFGGKEFDPHALPLIVVAK